MTKLILGLEDKEMLFEILDKNILIVNTFVFIQGLWLLLALQIIEVNLVGKMLLMMNTTQCKKTSQLLKSNSEKHTGPVRKNLLVFEEIPMLLKKMMLIYAN